MWELVESFYFEVKMGVMNQICTQYKCGLKTADGFKWTALISVTNIVYIVI